MFWLTDGRARVTSDSGGSWDVGAERPMMLSAPVAYGFDTDATAMTLIHLSPALLGDSGGRTEFRQPDAADPGSSPSEHCSATSPGGSSTPRCRPTSGPP